jgi:hypothetical protein
LTGTAEQPSGTKDKLAYDQSNPPEALSAAWQRLNGAQTNFSIAPAAATI